MKSRKMLIAVVFSLSIAACGGSDSESSGISVSWDSDFERSFLDPEDDRSSALGDKPTDVAEAAISPASNKLKVEFDLYDFPSEDYLLSSQCNYSVYFESDAVNIAEEDGLEVEVPIFLLARLSNCGNSLSCDLDEANVSYGIYYEYGLSASSSLQSFNKSRSFADFKNEEGLIVFEIDRADFGKSLSSVKQKNLTTKQELGKLFSKDVVIAVDHGIRMEAECDGAYDLVPNEGMSYE